MAVMWLAGEGVVTGDARADGQKAALSLVPCGMLTKYTPSGTFTGKIFVGAPLVLLGAAVLGAVYQVLMHYVPLIILEILVVVGMCFVTALIVGMLIKATHCRNRVAGAAIGLAAGVVAVAVGHFVEYRLSRPGIVASAPTEIRAAVDANLSFFDYCEIRAESGWSFGKVGSSSAHKPSIWGVFVYIVWGIEALILVGASTVGGFTSASAPYCEPCGKWADYDMLTLEVPEPSAETTANIKGALSVTALIPSAAAMIPPPPPPIPATPDDPKEAKKQAKELAKAAKAPKTTSCLRYRVKSCPNCKVLHTLKVEHETVTVASGKTQKNTKTIHDSIVLSSEEVGMLAQLKV